MEPQRNSVFQHGPLALQMPKRYNLLFQLSYLAIISTKIFHQTKLGRYFFWQYGDNNDEGDVEDEDAEMTRCAS